MGKRDLGHKEAKKPKKDAKKTFMANMQPPPPPVEVIRRGKKDKLEEE
ncbi:MAG: hypothetical protein PHY28_07845 [Dehalococcoidales bacterium]|nr:hypothetical protein [Dehalococcoidales bacterium]